MGEILKFPGEAARLGYSRVRKRGARAGDPNQLDLFLSPPARISDIASGLSPFEQALLCDERGDVRAAELYAKAIENHDCVADAFCNLGILESKKGNTARAFDCFTTSLKHDPRHSEAHYNLANLYGEIGNFQLAKAHYEISIQLCPSFPNSYFNLGLTLAMNKEFDRAIKSIKQFRKIALPEDQKLADDLIAKLITAI